MKKNRKKFTNCGERKQRIKVLNRKYSRLNKGKDFLLSIAHLFPVLIPPGNNKRVMRSEGIHPET